MAGNPFLTLEVQSFVIGISNSRQSILKFMKGYDTFMTSHSRTKQTNLYVSAVKVQETIASIKEITRKVCAIDLDGVSPGK